MDYSGTAVLFLLVAFGALTRTARMIGSVADAERSLSDRWATFGRFRQEVLGHGSSHDLFCRGNYFSQSHFDDYVDRGWYFSGDHTFDYLNCSSYSL